MQQVTMTAQVLGEVSSAATTTIIENIETVSWWQQVLNWLF